MVDDEGNIVTEAMRVLARLRGGSCSGSGFTKHDVLHLNDADWKKKVKELDLARHLQEPERKTTPATNKDGAGAGVVDDEGKIVTEAMRVLARLQGRSFIGSGFTRDEVLHLSDVQWEQRIQKTLPIGFTRQWKRYLFEGKQLASSGIVKGVREQLLLEEQDTPPFDPTISAKEQIEAGGPFQQEEKFLLTTRKVDSRVYQLTPVLLHAAVLATTLLHPEDFIDFNTASKEMHNLLVGLESGEYATLHIKQLYETFVGNIPRKAGIKNLLPKLKVHIFNYFTELQQDAIKRSLNYNSGPGGRIVELTRHAYEFSKQRQLTVHMTEEEMRHGFKLGKVVRAHQINGVALENCGSEEEVEAALQVILLNMNQHQLRDKCTALGLSEAGSNSTLRSQIYAKLKESVSGNGMNGVVDGTAVMAEEQEQVQVKHGIPDDEILNAVDVTLKGLCCKYGFTAQLQTKKRKSATCSSSSSSSSSSAAPPGTRRSKRQRTNGRKYYIEEGSNEDDE